VLGGFLQLQARQAEGREAVTERKQQKLTAIYADDRQTAVQGAKNRFPQREARIVAPMLVAW